MKLITADDLRALGQTIDARTTLPVLVRKLIRASVKEIDHIRFPSGELHGWDGILEVSDGNEFVPSGISLWEMSSRQDIRKKADDDYRRRVQNPYGYEPQLATFVFVTPHPWEAGGQWRTSKQTDGVWLDVRVIDGPMIEDWIENVPP